MSATLDSTWGPYRSQSDALFSLGRFANRACGPGIGLAWCSGGMLYPLRTPVYDGDGFGDVLTIEWNPPPAHPAKLQPAPSAGFWDRLVRMIQRSLEMQGEAEIAQAQAQAQAWNAIANSPLFKRFGSHADDGVGVALDVIGVVASIALASTGIGALGLLALIGSGALLVADGTIYGTEMAGNDELADRIRKKSEGLRIAATIATLPDLAIGGAKALCELREAEELLQADRTTAQTAQKLSARTATKARAAQYAQIVEKAHLRTQLRMKQIQASMTLEIAPRVAGTAGTSLLIREEVMEETSVLNQVRQWLRMHVVSVQR